MATYHAWTNTGVNGVFSIRLRGCNVNHLAPLLSHCYASSSNLRNVWPDFHSHPRYIAAVTVLLFAIALVSVRFEPTDIRLLRGILGAGLVIFAVVSLPGIVDVITAAFSSHPDPMIEVAEGLERSGIRNDTHVATVGPAIYAYWARLARVNLAAEIWNDGVPQFWSADPVRRREMALRHS